MRLAVVLFNLGGPDRLEAVEPFLRNLFSDPAIIGLPAIVRLPLARLIAWRRKTPAKKIYGEMGGGSPILQLTNAQANALEAALAGAATGVKVFVAMRYWHPLTEETVTAVKAWGPDQIVLLPLYPQYSTTTSGSSMLAWMQASEKLGLAAPTRAIRSYPTEPGLIKAHADLLRRALASIGGGGRPRVLFSAHGLPEKIVAEGDPYPAQVEQTVAAVVREIESKGQSLDWVLCYQSRVGPLKWIGPSTISEIERAGRDGVAVAITPIAFVGEHSETLVELDIEYRKLAEDAGVPQYVRVPALGTHGDFIAGLARLVKRELHG